MTYSHGVGQTDARLPAWLRRPIAACGAVDTVAGLLGELNLNTVCESAKCPNRGECYSSGTATFLIMGDACTRRCRFCAVDGREPYPLDPEEPERVAEAARRMGLSHAVVTCVTRDDIPDGGAAHFVATVEAMRAGSPRVTVEVLTSDFAGRMASVDAVTGAGPDVFGHNVETVPRLYADVRPGADYTRSLGVLARAKAGSSKAGSAESGRAVPGRAKSGRAEPGRVGSGRIESGRDKSALFTKSGLMLGLGESAEEVVEVMCDLREAGCDMLTLGQYLRPSVEHMPVARFVKPTEFESFARKARELGFSAVASGPFVRSSYRAAELAEAQAAEIAQDRSTDFTRAQAAETTLESGA